MKYIDVVKEKLIRNAKLFLFTSDEEFESALKHEGRVYLTTKNRKENNWKKFLLWLRFLRVTSKEQAERKWKLALRKQKEKRIAFDLINLNSHIFLSVNL